MKLQELTESMKSRLNGQSILRSELVKKEKLVEELKKEIEVKFLTTVFVCLHCRAQSKCLKLVSQLLD